MITIGGSDDIFMLICDNALMPQKIVENLEKTERYDWQCRRYDFSDPNHRYALYTILNEFAIELDKYRQYFKEHNIDNIEILYGDIK